MLVTNKKRFIQVVFDSEEEIENVVVENATDFFGPNSMYFPKSLIKTLDGAGTIPDGFAIDLAERRWFIVEVETSKHSVWGHIAEQVMKQLVAARRPETKKKLVNLAVKRVQEEPQISELFTEAKIHLTDVRKVLDEILASDPIVGMPIDAVAKDLEGFASILKIKVQFWLIKKHIELGNPKSVLYEIPDDYKPTISTVDDGKESKSTIARYDLSIFDLIDVGAIEAGEKLTMTYGPRNGEKKVYEGVVEKDGSIRVLGKSFPSPSYAAVYVIQSAGSKRKTVNGWTSWRNSKGVLLFDVRDEYLKHLKSEYI